MKSDQIYDVAVIGSGPAGEKAAIEAASLGASVVIIEKGIRPGGASVITGTIPSKSLRETVKHVESLCGSDVSGLDFGLDRQLSIKELMHRKNVVTSERIEDILNTYRQNGIEYVFGTAKFSSPQELMVENFVSERSRKIKAKKFIVAVGTVPYHPPDIAFDGVSILDSDSVLALKKIPETIVIFGGGVIGCEYACIFTRLGTKVYLIDPRGSLLNFIDPEISKALAELMEKDCIVLKLGEEYKKIAADDDGVYIALKSGETLGTSVLLYANGRQGTADQLDLSKCGLDVNHRNQLDVNHNYQTNVPHIYAVGDIIGFPSLVAVSNEEGRLAAQHAVCGTEVRRVGDDIPYGIYTIPEISMIGPTEDQLKEKGVPFAVGTCYYKDLARGLIIGERKGLLKLVFHQETHQLLGVHIFGQAAAELIHIGQVVLNFQGKIEYFVENVFNFPTLAAAYKVAARDGLSRLNSFPGPA